MPPFLNCCVSCVHSVCSLWLEWGKNRSEFVIFWGEMARKKFTFRVYAVEYLSGFSSPQCKSCHLTLDLKLEVQVLGAPSLPAKPRQLAILSQPILCIPKKASLGFYWTFWRFHHVLASVRTYQGLGSVFLKKWLSYGNAILPLT